MADIHIVLIMTLVKLFMCGHKQIIYLQNISSQKKSIPYIILPVGQLFCILGIFSLSISFYVSF